VLELDWNSRTISIATPPCRDADDGELVGLEDLLDVALGDDVAHGRAPVAGHDDAVLVRDGDDRGAVRRLDRAGRQAQPRWEQIRCCSAEELGEAAAAGRGEVSR
jgi:hypothetical protein